MKIGKGTERSIMVYGEVDLTRNTELTGNFKIPTKQSFCGECYVRLYRYSNYYVDWNGKTYHVDSPEKYDILVNIISTEFALARLE